MSSLCGRALALLLALVALAGVPVRAEEQAHVLRVCADPNDLPLSNDREQGFENRIVRLIAADLDMALEYTWWAQHRGFMTGSCVLCHAIAGTSAGGVAGPNLTHVASRRNLAAGTLPNTRGHLAGWIVDPQSRKPGSNMPPNPLRGDELQALLSYIETLR
jgi:cytochrome c1